MNTHINTKTGERFPAGLWSWEVKGQNLLRFVRGKGTVKIPLKNILGEVIPDLSTSHSYDQLAEYARTYGRECAEAVANTCGIMQAAMVSFALDPQRPDDEFHAWFAETFKTRLDRFYDSLFYCLGKFSFDILKFEKFIAANEGYNVEGNDSIKWFIGQRYGKDVAAKFETVLFPKTPIQNQ